MCTIRVNNEKRVTMKTSHENQGKYSQPNFDPLMTEKTFNKLKKRLDELRKEHEQTIDDVSRLGEIPGFLIDSDYEVSQGRLMRINDEISALEHQLDIAVIIKHPKQCDTVEIGHTVTVEHEGERNMYTILGSSDADPSNGIISHDSPIGEALIGKKVGESVHIRLPEHEVKYKILKIE